MQIFVFGDSITYGAWDEGGGWVQRLRKYLESKVDLVDLKDTDTDYLVYNLGIGGNTSADVLARFDAEARTRIMEDEEATLIIVELGGNDSSIINATGENRVPIEKFEQNIHQLISLSRKYTSNILFMGPMPCIDSITNPLKFNPSRSIKNSEQAKYNEVMKRVCREQKIDFISLYDKFLRLDYAPLLPDGAHPNSKGHRKLFSIVRSHLKKRKLVP